jgi:hypothetical protein
MQAILIMFGLLGLVGIGAAVWVVWGEPVEGELRRGSFLIGLSVAVLVLAMAFIFNLQTLKRDSGTGEGNLAGPGDAIEGAVHRNPEYEAVDVRLRRSA